MVDVRMSEGERYGGSQSQQPDLLAALQRQWMTILVAALVGTMIGWVYAASRPTVYESRSTLLLVAAGDEESPGGGRDRTLDIETWATRARSTALLQQVANELQVELDDVRQRTTALAAATGDTMVITYQAGGADQAVRGATVYSDEFLTSRDESVNATTIAHVEQLEALQDELESQVAELSAEIEAEERQGDLAREALLNQLEVTQQLAIERLSETRAELATLDPEAETGRILIDPSTAVSQTGLSRELTTLAGLFVGALIGLILALLRDRYDDRYGTQASAQLGINEIARVPHRRHGASAKASAAHAYSRLITRLTFARHGNSEHGRAVLLLPVDSQSLPDDIATSVANSLATSADLTGILIDIWSDSVDIEARPGHWADTLDDVDQLREQNDLVLIPVHGLDQSAAGIGLASLVDDTVLLVAEATPMTSVLDALDDLRAVGADNVQVVVVTGVSRRSGPRTATTASSPATTSV